MAMKLGAENKVKVAIAVVLVAVVLALVLRTVFSLVGGGSTPPPLPPQVAQNSAPQTSTQTQPASGGEHKAVLVSGSLEHLDPTLHPEWMAAAESLKYEGNGRNIFSMTSMPVNIPKPAGPIRPNAHAAAVAQGPPPPPPIDLKFYGFASQLGAKKVFLLHGNDIFIATAGDVVDHRYKVVSIAPLSIQVQDIPNNDTQTLPLIQN